MHGMNYIGRFFHNFKEFYNDINGATLTGAIDVIVVEQQDGSYNCSPFHVRFGKLGVLRSKEKIVDIEINGEPQEIHMKLGESGEAFFVETNSPETEEIPDHLATSPIPISHLEELYNAQGRRRNSISLVEDSKEFAKIENQVNDYTKRRYTAGNDDERNRKREFLERQIVLGNIEVREQSTEDLSLSMQSAKLTSDDITTKDDVSETIFHMDSLDMDSKSEDKNEEILPKTELLNKVQLPTTPSQVQIQIENEVTRSGNKKKKRKKSLMKKKNSQRKTSAVNEPQQEGVGESAQESSTSDVKGETSSTDRSSMGSAPEEIEQKELPKIDTDASPCSNNSRKVLDPEFHFFSDTELTTGQEDSRPNTPIHIESVQSDTEFEVQKSKGGKNDNDSTQSWAWGEFPVNVEGSTGTSGSTQQIDKEQQHNSMLSSMFSFMKQTKYRQRNSASEGMYLAELSSGAIDPSVAALYFQGARQKKDGDMDCESGNGPSLTQSPNSVEGSKSIDSDFDDPKIVNSYFQDVALSMCGWEPEPNERNFIKHIVPFSDLCNNPSLLESPNLVVRLRNKYYTWKVAAPIISSIVIYQRPLPQPTVDQLCNLHMPQPSSAQEKEQKEEKQQESRYSWFKWGRSRTSRETTPALESVPIEIAKEIIKDKVEDDKDNPNTSIDIEAIEETRSNSSGSETGKDISEVKSMTEQTTSTSVEKCRKTLRLTSDQIARLNLRDGMNEVEFSVTTAYQGTTRCKCHLYKWKWDDKIVISDIDGTITKSDVLGHILPIVGKDWAQSGVAQLFNKIKDNGYRLLYLSARAIGQARLTREYLKSIRQGDLTMPDGPLLLNPTSLITAFHREVIEKKPELFKISCLSDIRALFPSDSNPFYAGYGNRINDVWAYTAVGIPIVRIFTINPKGELKHELTQTFQSSYSNMTYIVDQLFPSLPEDATDYSQFVYWREPLILLEELGEVA
ncbi:phosphatidate phosphatase LPIN3 isoform X1 [Onthophagus taurus]|uniref:phosphatidate phosphatase LPIN3 isoform X1 n=1 Tax=Onthophagus taurus TaxID=166361 RepID=UPI0039BEBE09